MAKIGMREMLEAGAHFGHQTRRWNPKMERYIFGPRNGIHIIDLQQTVDLFDKAYNYISDTVAKGGKVLFVGTKKQAQEIMAEEAGRCHQYYVNNRWLGGMLTNFKTIKLSVDRMLKLEAMSKDGTFERLPKKEVVKLSREFTKLEKNLAGIRDMTKLPKVIFIVDPKQETIAVDEALKLSLPIVATVDTNCNPEVIDFPVPANDDSIRSIKLFVSKIADACIEGLARHEEDLVARRARGESDEQKMTMGEGQKRPSNLPIQKKRKGPMVEVIHATPEVIEQLAEEGETESEAEGETEEKSAADKNSHSEVA